MYTHIHTPTAKSYYYYHYYYHHHYIYFTDNRFFEHINLLVSTAAAHPAPPTLDGMQWTTVVEFEGPPDSQRINWQSFDNEPIGRHIAIFSLNEDQQLCLQEVEAYGTGE